MTILHCCHTPDLRRQFDYLTTWTFGGASWTRSPLTTTLWYRCRSASLGKSRIRSTYSTGVRLREQGVKGPARHGPWRLPHRDRVDDDSRWSRGLGTQVRCVWVGRLRSRLAGNRALERPHTGQRRSFRQRRCRRPHRTFGTDRPGRVGRAQHRRRIVSESGRASPRQDSCHRSACPGSVESPVAGWDPAPLDQCVVFTDEMVRSLFANSECFPQQAIGNYRSSLVPLTPRIFNASLGLNMDLKTDPAVAPGWGSQIPVLLLVADQDQLIPEARAEETSTALGVPITRLATDWGLSGHGHNFIIEMGSEEIAQHVDAWLSSVC